MVEQRSVDIVMVDLLRAGGITPFRKIAGMAEAFNLPVVSQSDTGSAGAHHRRHSQRAYGGVYALVAAAV